MLSCFQASLNRHCGLFVRYTFVSNFFLFILISAQNNILIHVNSNRLECTKGKTSEQSGLTSTPFLHSVDGYIPILRSPKHNHNFFVPAEQVIIYYITLSLLPSFLVETLQWLLARNLAKGISSVGLFCHCTRDNLSPYVGGTPQGLIGNNLIVVLSHIPT